MTGSRESPSWLYLSEAPPVAPKLSDLPVEARDAELGVGKAWQRLQVLHTPFRSVDAEEYRWIVNWLAQLERLFLERPELEFYYQECFAPESGLSPPPAAGSADPSELAAMIAHVATIQAQFMEEVYYTLSLNRHANAVDNRGWINLFRRWGRSRRFNERLEQIRSLLTLEFLSFYDLYLRNFPCRIDEEPIPHPWDSESRRKDPRGLGALPERTGGSPGPDDCLRSEPRSTRQRRRDAGAPEPGDLPGIYLDSGVREAGSKPLRPDAVTVPQPASARHDSKEHPGEGARGSQGGTSAEQGRSSAEPGGSAPTAPNE